MSCNDFGRNYTRTDIVPINSDHVAAREQISESNRLAREQWAVSIAARQLREHQDKALAYLAQKQMEKDRKWWRRALRFLTNAR